MPTNENGKLLRMTNSKLARKETQNKEKHKGFLFTWSKLGPAFTPAGIRGEMLREKIRLPFYPFVGLDVIDARVTDAPLEIEPRITTTLVDINVYGVTQEFVTGGCG